MRISRLALTAVLAAVSAAFAPGVRAEDDDEGFGGERVEERVEVRKRAIRDDHDRRGGGEGEPGRRPGREDGEGRGMRERDPEMLEKHDALRELEKKSREQAARAREGSDADKAAAKTELRKTLGELYDAKLAMDAAVLAKLEKHAAEMKARIAKKKSSRDKAIESRLSRMTGEGDDW